MTAPLLAKALARGVEIAVLTPFLRWRDLLATHETISDAIFDDDGSSVATYELLAVQEFDEPSGRQIEVRILASDGRRQETAYFYARETGAEAAT